MTHKKARAARPDGQVPPGFCNPFTRHLDGSPPQIDTAKMERSASMSRRQTAAVSRNAQIGRNLSLPGSEINRPYFGPVVGREGSQQETDRRARNRKASI